MEARLGLTLLCLMAATACVNTKSYAGYQLLRVLPSTYEQLEGLHQLSNSFSELDFWTKLRTQRNVDINVPPSLVGFMSEEMARLGLEVTVIQEDVQKLIDDNQPETTYPTLKEKMQKLVERTVDSPDIEKLLAGDAASLEWLRKEIMEVKDAVGEGASPVVGSFPRYDDLLAWMERMENVYPDLAKIQDIGTTYEGRPQRLIKIGQGTNYTKPAIWFDGGIHAREWLTVGASVWIINKMLTQYNHDLDVKTMMDRYDWYILPVFNPDGYEYTHTNDRLWRKTRTPIENSACIGVDPNRNFDFEFGSNGTMNNPCDDAYGGTQPFSVPCTKNVRNALTLLNGTTELYINLQAFGEVWLTPYAAQVLPPANNANQVAAAKRGADTIYYKSAVKYEVGEGDKALYPAPGAVMDWATGIAGANYSYTLELGPNRHTFNGFVVPASVIPATGNVLWSAFVEVAFYINQK